jgi:hypothetical protein
MYACMCSGRIREEEEQRTQRKTEERAQRNGAMVWCSYCARDQHAEADDVNGFT